MADLDQLTDLAIDTIGRAAGQAKRISTFLVVMTSVMTLGSFALLLVITPPSAQLVVAITGGILAAIGIGAAVLTRWRFGWVGRHLPVLGKEIKSMLGNAPTGEREEFIDAVLVDDTGTPATTGDTQPASGTTTTATGGVWRVQFQSFDGLRTMMSTGSEQYGNLARMLTAVTSFPALALTSILITTGFVVITAIAGPVALIFG